MKHCFVEKNGSEKPVSKKSALGLDLVNVFMADVRDGVGVYLSVFLLTEHHWNPSRIGMVVAIPSLVSILVQSPMGGFIDYTKKKRLILVIASIIVALSCLVIIFFPFFFPIAISQAALGIVQTIFPPCVAAISLGMVGPKRISWRVGRNESFNHAGNMLAAVIAIFIGLYISYAGIFYFSVIQCIAIIIATLLIREKDIDHNLAREASLDDNLDSSYFYGLKKLFSNRNVPNFIIAVVLWNLANSAMLPLLGQKLGITDIQHSALYLSICIIIAQTVMIIVAPIAAKKSEKGRKKLFLVAFLLIPVRALLFSWVENKYALISFQAIDGLGAGIYGVLSILMMADLGRGTGRFNLLQGTTYAAIGLGVALSNTLAGFAVSRYGYSIGFLVLAYIGIIATLFFVFFVRETVSSSDHNNISCEQKQAS